MTEHPTQKRTLEDIAATQAEHTLFLARIAERLDEHTTLLVQQSELLTRIVGRLDAQGTVLQRHSSQLSEHTAMLKAIIDRLPSR